MMTAQCTAHSFVVLDIFTVSAPRPIQSISRNIREEAAATKKSYDIEYIVYYSHLQRS